jgi:hypothetical protein
MDRRIESVTSAEFNNLFTGFAHTAYRLETLQVYDVGYEDESYAAFLAGHPLPTDMAKDEWTAMLAAAAGDGKVFQRVHIVTEPLTDYVRYEIEWSYAPNVAAGDDVRILVGTPEQFGLPDHDYWLFDSRDLWVMRYDSDGRFLHAEQVSDPAVVVDHNYWRDSALTRAMPYTEYLNRALITQAAEPSERDKN